MRYFFAQNAGRLIGGTLEFNIYDVIGGSAVGVYETEDPAELELLDKLIADPSSAVSEISQAEYEGELKKKRPGFRPYIPSNPSPKPSASPMKGHGAVVVVEQPPEAKEEVVEIKGQATIEDALKVAPVAPQPPLPEPIEESRTRKRGKK